MDMLAMLSVIGMLFLLLACGFICRRTGVIDHTGSKKLSELIIKVGQPFMIVSALSQQEYTTENLHLALIATGIGIGMHVLTAAFAFFALKPVRNLDERKICEFGTIFANTGFLGFPIMRALFGEKGLFMAAFYIIGFNVLLWTWGIVVLGRGRSDIRMTAKKAFFNYGTIPCVIGFLVFLSRAWFGNYVIPDAISGFLNALSNLCTPISVLVTGSLLATVRVRSFFERKSIWYLVAIKLLIWPVLVCLLAKLFRLPSMYALFCTAMAALPSASTVAMLTEMYDIEPGYSSQIVGLTTLLFIGTLPLIMLMAQWIIT